MALFKKKNGQYKPRETNAIADTALQEKISALAVQMLQPEKEYEDKAHISVEFGYLFDIEGHGIEALFKLITDRTIAYFAVQGTKLRRLALSEALFRSTVEGFMDLHG